MVAGRGRHACGLLSRRSRARKQIRTRTHTPAHEHACARTHTHTHAQETHAQSHARRRAHPHAHTSRRRPRRSAPASTQPAAPAPRRRRSVLNLPLDHRFSSAPGDATLLDRKGGPCAAGRRGRADGPAGGRAGGRAGARQATNCTCSSWRRWRGPRPTSRRWPWNAAPRLPRGWRVQLRDSAALSRLSCAVEKAARLCYCRRA